MLTFIPQQIQTDTKTLKYVKLQWIFSVNAVSSLLYSALELLSVLSWCNGCHNLSSWE